ncbi:PREDICTED: solute carrier family 23 member 2-like [Acropora digitifera]|uniref:solute carrier family 23 member 2-like n=1 Tax=Acropora digitifera TaxID=70779 RepID=UPI00077A8F59|nr:PREDICTED: solute carrier family 23 member 2-like [Acropora digitifera]
MVKEELELTGNGTSPKAKNKALGLSYLINENPPWYICLLLGFQHYLTMLGGTLAIPYVLSSKMCFADNTLAISEVLSTIFFASGIVTLLQSTFGVRLPIVQGGTFAFITPTIAILSLPQWECPTSGAGKVNATVNANANATEAAPESYFSPLFIPFQIQGAIMVSALFQIMIGFTGLVGFLLRFIGPLTIAPTITLVGVALFGIAADHAGNHWGISMTYSKGSRFALFRLFPVILAIAVSWIICAIITAAGGFPNDSKIPQYKARTDARIAVLKEAKWFRFPYPGQWGMPTVSAAGVFGMLAGVLASIIESVGDYYACARLSGAPPPPRHAICRGIGMEGIGCLLTGALGTGNGTTSYSENIGAIGITKVNVFRFCHLQNLFLTFKTSNLAVAQGVAEIDQIITVLFSTSMAVGCIVALILDNTIPGTDEERGIKAWRQHLSSEDCDEQFQTAPIEVYNLPCGLNVLSKYKVSKWLPFLPYKGDQYNTGSEYVTPSVQVTDSSKGVL